MEIIHDCAGSAFDVIVDDVAQTSTARCRCPGHAANPHESPPGPTPRPGAEDRGQHRLGDHVIADATLTIGVADAGELSGKAAIVGIGAWDCRAAAAIGLLSGD
jgi:hypothetical protein